MDGLLDCLFCNDNVDLLGENCQGATDGFIMLRHNINMNYDTPAPGRTEPHSNISGKHTLYRISNKSLGRDETLGLKFHRNAS